MAKCVRALQVLYTDGARAELQSLKAAGNERRGVRAEERWLFQGHVHRARRRGGAGIGAFLGRRVFAVGEFELVHGGFAVSYTHLTLPTILLV